MRGLARLAGPASSSAARWAVASYRLLREAWFQPDQIPPRADVWIPYHELELDGRLLAGRAFAPDPVWSAAEGLLLIAEWLPGPEGSLESVGLERDLHSRLLLFDLPAWREALVARIAGRFVPRAIEAEALVYLRRPAGFSAEQECEVARADLLWRPIEPDGKP